MQQFQLVKPYDAEILKGKNTWQCYDSTCVRVGDIVRVTKGDIVPADVVLLSLGMEHYTSSVDASEIEAVEGNLEKELELVVESKYVTGRERPTSYSIHEGSKRIQMDDVEETEDELDQDKDKSQELYCGSQILQGAAIAVVTRIGDDTKLATLIQEGKWPLPNVRVVRNESNYSLVATSNDV